MKINWRILWSSGGDKNKFLTRKVKCTTARGNEEILNGVRTAVSFDAAAVGPNIHNAEEEEEEVDYEGQSERGFLHVSQVIARHKKTVHDWSRPLPPFRSVCERLIRSVCYALLCISRQKPRSGSWQYR